MFAASPISKKQARWFRPLLWAFVVIPVVIDARGQEKAAEKEKGWVALFNGKDLDGWTPKIQGYAAGDNYGDTFRVEDGVLKVVVRQVHQVRRQVRPPVLQDARSRTTGCGSNTASSANSAPAGRAGRSRTAAS